MPVFLEAAISLYYIMPEDIRIQKLHNKKVHYNSTQESCLNKAFFTKIFLLT